MPELHDTGYKLLSCKHCHLHCHHEMDSTAHPAKLGYCPSCVKELGQLLTQKAMQPTHGSNICLVNDFKSLLDDLSLVSMRVSVVVREDDEPLLASVGNLLDDVQNLTLFCCTRQALLTTVMEGTYADTWRPIRYEGVQGATWQYQCSVSGPRHFKVLTDDHGGAYFFSLPIRCAKEDHVDSAECRAVGLLTLGWSTVPPHIPRVMPMVREVVAAMGCGFGAAVEGLVHDVVTYFVPSLGPLPSFPESNRWDACLSDERMSTDSDEGHPPDTAVISGKSSRTQGQHAGDESIPWDLERRTSGDAVWGPRNPDELNSCRQGGDGSSTLHGDEAGCASLPGHSRQRVFLAREGERPDGGTAAGGLVSDCLPGDGAEGGKENAGMLLYGEDGGQGSLSKEVQEKQSCAVARQAGVGPRSRVVQQSALWLTFDDADLEARFLASQAAKAAPNSLAFAAFGVVVFLLIWRDPAVSNRNAIAMGLATLVPILAIHVLLQPWWEKHHELLSGAANALMTAIMGWHFLLNAASPMTDAEAKAFIGYRSLMYTIVAHACTDIVHKFRYKMLIMKAFIGVPISVWFNQQVMMVCCQYPPTLALGLSAIVTVFTSVAMQAAIRHWESLNRARFLQILGSQA